jgi:C1A family cysteine protease
MTSVRVLLSVSVLTAAVLLALVADAAKHDKQPGVTDQVDAEDSEWKGFKRRNNKSYKNAKEEKERKQIWKTNVDSIKKHNLDASRGLSTYRMASNKFADMTTDEFQQMLGATENAPKQRAKQHGKNKTPQDDIHTHQFVDFEDCVDFEEHEPEHFFNNVPLYKNWVTDGLVTPVKDQNVAATCYAFAAATAIESQIAMYDGLFYDLSEQQISDCSFGYGNNGILGGMPYRVFAYVVDNGNMIEDDYYYTAVQENCSYDASKIIDNEVYGCARLPTYNETYLKAAVAKLGPFTAVMHVFDSLRFYYDGIYEESACIYPDMFNHGVVVVGYGTSSDVDYWLVRNSWSDQWGDGGYFKMRRNMNNMCSIATECVYPWMYSDLPDILTTTTAANDGDGDGDGVGDDDGNGDDTLTTTTAANDGVGDDVAVGIAPRH